MASIVVSEHFAVAVAKSCFQVIGVDKLWIIWTDSGIIVTDNPEGLRDDTKRICVLRSDEEWHS